MKITDRLQACEQAIKDTLDQIKMLQSRHQQLIGYQQALQDVKADQEEAVPERQPRKKSEQVKETAA